MSGIQAAQMVYTHVEARQSPCGRPGFQTLLATAPPIDREELREIETRLMYRSREGAPATKLFFPTSRGHIVVGKVVTLAERDAAGRSGRYLAHCLVFAPQEFQLQGANPFPVLDSFPFFRSVEEAIQAGELERGYIGPALFELSDESEGPASGDTNWPREELLKLAHLGLRARWLQEQRTIVALVGSDEEIENGLRLLLAVLPPQRVADCSFDTYFDGCNPRLAPFFAVGLSTRPQDQRYIIVDAHSRRVLANIQFEPPSAYERWVRTRLAAGRAGAPPLCGTTHGRWPNGLKVARTGQPCRTGYRGSLWPRCSGPTPTCGRTACLPG